MPLNQQNLEQGTTIFLFEPHEWPPTTERVIWQSVGDKGKFVCKALPTGSLSFEARGEGREFRFVSQPIVFDLPADQYPAVPVALLWKDWAPSIGVGDVLIPSFDVAGEFKITKGRKPASQFLSVLNPDAQAICQAWIDKRRAKFGAHSPRQGRSPINIDVQARQLLNASANLRHHTAEILNGNHGLLGTVAAELRGLLYWRVDGAPDPTYNPLLFRMASRGDLPLPVYSIDDSDHPEVDAGGSMVYVELQRISLESRFSTDRLMDLQAALKQTCLVLGPEGPKLSVIQTIAEVAHTMGSAHYDESVSEAILAIESFSDAELGTLERLICQFASAVSDLGRWVLLELQKKAIVGTGIKVPLDDGYGFVGQ